MFKSRLLKSAFYGAFVMSAATLTACGGGSGSSSVPPATPPPPPAADTTLPVVSFSPNSLTVESGATGSSTLTATDNVGVTSGPSVACTNGGSFSGSTFTAPSVTAATTSVCTATASDAAGNSGTGTLTVTIPQPQNSPTASAVSNITLVSEGQPFSLDASGSTDADGDALTYSWRQISGSSVTFSDATSAAQNLTAPLASQDETLTFEVSVSDGSNTSSVEVSIDVDDIQPMSLDNKVTPFFTGSQPLRLISFTPKGADSYIAHWVGSGGTASFPTSSQEFSFEDEEIGAQVNGEFTAQGAQTGGAVAYIFQSGNDVTYVNRTNGYAVHRGLVDGTVAGFGDTFYNVPRPTDFDSNYAAPIGGDQVVFVANTGSAADDYAINAAVVQADGSSITAEISPLSDKVKTNLTVEAYSDTEFAVFWWEHNADVTGTDIYMQRATTAGALVGGKVLISSGRSNLGPIASLLSNGNLLVTWSNVASGVFTTKGKILLPDGTVFVDEFEIDRPIRDGGVGGRILPLSSGRFLFVKSARNSSSNRDIKGRVFDGTGNEVGNQITIAEDFDSNTIIADRNVVSSENKVVIGWQSFVPSEGIIRNFNVGFYPVGRE